MTVGHVSGQRFLRVTSLRCTSKQARGCVDAGTTKRIAACRTPTDPCAVMYDNHVVARSAWASGWTRVVRREWGYGQSAGGVGSAWDGIDGDIEC